MMHRKWMLPPDPSVRFSIIIGVIGGVFIGMGVSGPSMWKTVFGLIMCVVAFL